MDADYTAGAGAETEAAEVARWLEARLERGPALLLDGATGTELERRGVPAGLPLWSAHALLEAPDVLAAIHADYARAGAEILTASTFRTQRRTLATAGTGGRAAELSTLAVELAREGASDGARRVLVAGSDAPLEDCYRPELVPDERALEEEHAEHARHLADAGADLILVETMNTAREALAAARAARATGLPFLVSFIASRDARLLSGEPLAEALDAVLGQGPMAALVNCLPPSAVAPCLPVLRAAGVAFGVYANLGAPEGDAGRRTEDCPPDRFAALAAEWVGAGARLVGGCCGTTPAHIRAVAARLRGSDAGGSR